MSEALLPPNATRLEKAMANAIAEVLTIDVPIEHLLDPDRCPPEFLPWLAWSLSVDTWDDSWAELTKRAVIRQSVAVHRRKGTIGAVRAALAAAGHPTAIIQEQWGQQLDGSWPLDGSVTLEGQENWADYRVILTRPVSVSEAALVRALLDAVAPVRSRLAALIFTEAGWKLDGSVQLNGSFNLGVA